MELIQCIKEQTPYAILIDLIDRLAHENPDALGFVNSRGDTPLILSCIYLPDDYSSQVALRLIETGHSNPDHANRKGDTALMEACFKGLTKVVLKLIEIGQDPGQVNRNNGTTPLMCCCINHPNLALILINTGRSNPGHVSRNGYTSLITACEYGNEFIALKILETGESNPMQINRFGKSALDYAKKRGFKRVIDYFNIEIRNDMANFTRASKLGTLKRLPDDMNATIASYLVPKGKNTIKLYKNSEHKGGKSKPNKSKKQNRKNKNKNKSKRHRR